MELWNSIPALKATEATKSSRNAELKGKAVPASLESYDYHWQGLVGIHVSQSFD